MGGVAIKVRFTIPLLPHVSLYSIMLLISIEQRGKTASSLNAIILRDMFVCLPQLSFSFFCKCLGRHRFTMLNFRSISAKAQLLCVDRRHNTPHTIGRLIHCAHGDIWSVSK